MKSSTTQKEQSIKSKITSSKQRTYNEIVEYLDHHWQPTHETPQLTAIQKLDKAFNTISQKIPAIFIAGTNGKTLTTHFTLKLFAQEGMVSGGFFSPHTLTYNERFIINGEIIPNKLFTDIANQVIDAAQALDTPVYSLDILSMMAMIYFEQQPLDVAVFELGDTHGIHPLSICNPIITGITRITPDDPSKTDQEITDITHLVKHNTHVVSADQSKLNLQVIQKVVEKQGGKWAMPIRKLAPLGYPFEQLHGRCAALAERIAHHYINEVDHKDTLIGSGSLLTKQKGQRGRPTLEAKRQSELHPKKTVDQFWKETLCTLNGRFQILDKEKPTLLLDTASNLDAIKNVLLGIRLLHYQRPIKGLTLILGGNNPKIEMTELLKLLRYFFKKNSGQIIVCPVKQGPTYDRSAPWDVEKITNDIKSMKIKARSATSFKAAFEAAQKTVDDRHGLLVITGSSDIVTEYWDYKGLKKL